MPLTRCLDCGKDVSSRAPACPGCGRPMAAPPPAPGAGRRVVRIFGGRKVTLRAENNGMCDPESCAEYQGKKCNLSGRFIFFVPGIKSISAFELPTNSFYAMQAAIEKFQAFLRDSPVKPDRKPSIKSLIEEGRE